MSFLNEYCRTEPRSITRRRELEDTRQALHARVAHDFSVNERSAWENRTHALVQKQALAGVARSLQQRDQAALQQRRARLAMLLTEEDEQYRSELAALEESSGDRAKRLVKEARRLKADREDKRRAFAEAQLERQWKDGCDDLRTIDSAFFKLHCNSEVIKQMDDKKQRQAEEEAEKQRWAGEWESERLKRVASEDARAARRQRDLLDNRRALKSQMEEQEAKKQAEWQNLQQEKAIFQKILDMDAAAAADKAAAEHARKRALQRDTVAYNEQLQRDREEAYRRQREEDKADLWAKMEEYKEDTRRVENDKSSQQRDIVEFKAYLQRRREDERRMEQEMERLVQEDLDRSNLKRDLQWEKERLAREQLMRDVYEGRSAQLAERARRRAQEEEELFMEKRAAEIEIARAHEDELALLAEEKRAAARRLRDLDSQVSINRERRRLQKEALEAELRAAEDAERVYKQKLDIFRHNTIEQSKRNYGIKHSMEPTFKVQGFARP